MEHVFPHLLLLRVFLCLVPSTWHPSILSLHSNVPHFLLVSTAGSTLVVTEGRGDLGITSYLTDADGNVIIGSRSRPTTPTQTRKSVTGKKMQKRKDSVILQKPSEEGKKEGKRTEKKDEKEVDKKDAVANTPDETETVAVVNNRETLE